MEMHQLRYVVAVARAGNFSRAAEKCHVAQPSLSQQIQKLEGELGERLFDRLKRAARLTPAGEVFLRPAVRILDEVDAARGGAFPGSVARRGHGWSVADNCALSVAARDRRVHEEISRGEDRRAGG